jgi:hypothetical protein
MFGVAFSRSGDLKEFAGLVAVGRVNRNHAGLAICKGSCLVEEHCVYFGELLQIDAPFDDGSLASRPADRPQYREGSTGGNSTGSRDDDD